MDPQGQRTGVVTCGELDEEQPELALDGGPTPNALIISICDPRSLKNKEK
jgi:hypothetical protein